MEKKVKAYIYEEIHNVPRITEHCMYIPYCHVIIKTILTQKSCENFWIVEEDSDAKKIVVEGGYTKMFEIDQTLISNLVKKIYDLEDDRKKRGCVNKELFSLFK